MDKLQQTFECQKKTFSTVYKETYNNESFNGLSCAFNYMCTSSHSSLIYSVTVLDFWYPFVVLWWNNLLFTISFTCQSDNMQSTEQ